MGDLGNYSEQSIKELLSEPNNTTSDSISTTTTTTSSSKRNVSKGMGGVVSRLNAVIFGSRPPRGFLGQLINNQNVRNKQNGISKNKNSTTSDSDYYDVEDIIVTESKASSGKDHTAIIIPPEDPSDTDSVLVTPRETFPERNQEVYRTDETSISQRNNHLNYQSEEKVQSAAAAEEVIVVSEGEASADEEQEAEESDAESEPALIERVESEPEEEDEEEADEEYEEDSDSDSEVDRLDEESDFEVDLDHICDSDCHHSEVESDDNPEESEIEEDEALSETNDEVVQFTDEENSEAESDSDYEREEQACDCDSACPSDCDGDHHECSSQCGCEIEYSESEDEVDEPDNETEQDTQQDNDRVSPLRETPPPIDGVHKRQASLPESSVLLLQANEVKQSQRANRLERNNNKLVVSNSVDLVDELQSAIDARVKRSASHREVPMYRKSSNSSLDDNRKVGHSEREAWRKDRRARLRTLELKREQILDEVRDGTKDRVNDAMYSEVSV